jgi:large conductance mechanosensitive channel
MFKEFKEFVSKGNVIDLAVAVVIGAAFAVIVKSFTDDILGQLLAALGGKPDFTSLTLTLRNVTVKGVETPVELRYGAFITAIINFLIVGFALFLVVKAANRMQTLRKKEEESEEAVATELELLTEIRDLLAASSGAPTGSSGGSSTEP